MDNIFANLPDKFDNEIADDLLRHNTLRIERIISKGHTSPEYGWYDQDDNEWVLVLEGAGSILFEDGRLIEMKKGDHITIPAHTKHKVTWTDPDTITVWLAVFYQ